MFLSVAVMLLFASGTAQAGVATVAPEIDGSSMTMALTLLVGIGVLLADRMRRRQYAS
jgi:hypothetical protein